MGVLCDVESFFDRRLHLLVEIPDDVFVFGPVDGRGTWTHFLER